MTSIAVVILNYNGEKLLPQFLPSVIEFSGDARVIVVDNGSTDSSVTLLQNSFPQVELIKLEQNFGFCGGYNAAIKMIDTDIVVLLNSDVEVTPGWLNSPVTLLKSDSRIAAVQPKILAYNNKSQFEYAGAAGGYIDSLGYPFCRGRIFQTLENDEGQYNDKIRVFWASGACMIIKRESYLEAGGLDEDFFAHMEEIDLCWRLNRAGYSIYFDGQSIVYHLGGGTLASGTPRKVYYNFKNGLSLLVKNLPASELLLKFPIRIGLDWIASLKFLFDGMAGNSWAVLRAHYFFFKFLRKDLAKRNLLKSIGFKTDKALFITQSIVYQYYILGKRRFTEIKNPK